MLIDKVFVDTKEIMYFEWLDSTTISISFDCKSLKDVSIIPCFTLLLVSSINLTSEKIGNTDAPSYVSRPYGKIKSGDKWTQISINKALNKSVIKDKIKIACEHLIKTKWSFGNEYQYLESTYKNNIEIINNIVSEMLSLIAADKIDYAFQRIDGMN